MSKNLYRLRFKRKFSIRDRMVLCDLTVIRRKKMALSYILSLARRFNQIVYKLIPLFVAYKLTAWQSHTI